MAEHSEFFGPLETYASTIEAVHANLFSANLLEAVEGCDDAASHWEHTCHNAQAMMKFTKVAVRKIQDSGLSLAGSSFTEATVQNDGEGTLLNAKTSGVLMPCKQTSLDIRRLLYRIAQTFWVADNLNRGAENGMFNRAWMDKEGRVWLSVLKPDTPEYKVPNSVDLVDEDRAIFAEPGNFEWRRRVDTHQGFPDDVDYVANTGLYFTAKRQLYKDGEPVICENGQTIEWDVIHGEPNHGLGEMEYDITDTIYYATPTTCAV